jgi:hypothetical protein
VAINARLFAKANQTPPLGNDLSSHLFAGLARANTQPIGYFTHAPAFGNTFRFT